MSRPRPAEPRRRRERGDDGISWDRANKCYMGTISLGYDDAGKRLRRTVRGKTKQAVKDKLDELHDEIKAGIWTPATYTVKQCVMDWLDSLELDPHTMATYRGQAEKWIYPKIGATKLKDFKATDADRFFRAVAKVLSKSSLVKIKSTLVRSIRRAQKYDLIGRNVAELVDLPQGQPGHPSRAMTEEQASQSAPGRERPGDRLRQGREGQPGQVRGDPRGHRDRRAGVRYMDAPGRSHDRDRHRSSRDHLPLLPRGSSASTTTRTLHRRLEALFVLSITLGLRPGELRKLGWDHVDLDNESHPRMAIREPNRRRQDPEVEALARCSPSAPSPRSGHTRSARPPSGWPRAPPGRTTTSCSATRTGACTRSDALNWRFSKMTKRAGIGHWHAHEGRHTAVSIMSSNGVPLQEISDTVGHKSTHVTETVYRHVIVPAIRGGATVMDSVFGDRRRRR